MCYPRIRYLGCWVSYVIVCNKRNSCFYYIYELGQAYMVTRGRRRGSIGLLTFPACSLHISCIHHLETRESILWWTRSLAGRTTSIKSSWGMVSREKEDSQNCFLRHYWYVASFPGLHAQILSLAVQRVGGRPGWIHHVMHAAADVTYCS